MVLPRTPLWAGGSLSLATGGAVLVSGQVRGVGDLQGVTRPRGERGRAGVNRQAAQPPLTVTHALAICNHETIMTLSNEHHDAFLSNSATAISTASAMVMPRA